MKIKEQILHFFDNQKEKFKIDRVQLAQKLSIDQNDYQLFFQALNMLVKENQLCRSKTGEYARCEGQELLKGQFRLNKRGFGFITVDGEEEEEDIFVAKENIGKALDGDEVLFKKIKDPKKPGKFAGRIMSVVNHARKEQVGLVEKFNTRFFRVVPDNAAYTAKIFIKRDASPEVVPGHKVLFVPTDFQKDNKVFADVLEILGHENDPGVDILSIVKQYGIPSDFHEDIYAEVKRVGHEPTEQDFRGRIDLTNELIVTIDGADAKDLDDAVQVKKDSHGNYVLGVHIADVSHYVNLGGAIDNEAFFRGTSVYLADRVIPMLPHQLSNGVCSLNTGFNRLTLTCEMVISPAGKVIDKKAYKSFVHTTERMTYDDVNAILEKKSPELTNKYKHLVSMFEEMYELSHILENRRVKNGSLDFAIDEAKIIVNDKGEAVDIVVRERGISEKIIEQFMIEANEAIASMFSERELPFIYRVHATPKDTKIDVFKQVARNLGVNVSAIKSAVSLKPKVLQKILADIEQKEEHTLLSSLLLKAMNKAEYSTKNVGHFGLASKDYTHFTSPIRRYPDLMVHRLIKHFIFEEQQVLNDKTITHDLEEAARESSITERRAIDCERAVDAMKMAEYMEKHIGEKYTGVISGITATSIFVELPNLVEGRIGVESLVDDYYIYIPEQLAMVGRSNGKRYQMGKKVSVTVVYASKEESVINFEITGMQARYQTGRRPARKNNPDSTSRSDKPFREKTFTRGDKYANSDSRTADKRKNSSNSRSKDSKKPATGKKSYANKQNDQSKNHQNRFGKKNNNNHNNKRKYQK